MTYHMFKRGIGVIADALADKINEDGLESAITFNSIFNSVLSMFGVKYQSVVVKHNEKFMLEVYANIHLWRVKVRREVKI